MLVLETTETFCSCPVIIVRLNLIATIKARFQRQCYGDDEDTAAPSDKTRNPLDGGISWYRAR